MDKLPVIQKDLLEFLNSTYPERCPEPSWSEREIWMRVGERRVVRNLQRIYEQQNENVLRDTNVFSS